VSQNVLADAQFTVAGVLRPFDGFEAVYQGQAVTIPIAFPGTLDDDAGKPGFSPYLLRGMPVPMGAKMALWFPQVTNDAEGNQLIDYRYLLVWRLRNVGDFQRRRLPYHLSKEAVGAPDTWLAGSPAQPLNQFVLPSATETVLYQQPEVTLPAPIPGVITAPGRAQGNLRTELINIPGDLLATFVTAGLPLLPPNAAPNFANVFPQPPATGGNGIRPLGAYQQGVIDPRISNTAPGAMFRPYFTVAKGDELIVICYRNNNVDAIPGSAAWNFGGLDQQFSNLYGTNAMPPSGQVSHKPFPDLGIYVFAGSNPS
jgi:hypothetical protein